MSSYFDTYDDTGQDSWEGDEITIKVCTGDPLALRRAQLMANGKTYTSASDQALLEYFQEKLRAQQVELNTLRALVVSFIEKPQKKPQKKPSRKRPSKRGRK